jgi:selenide,water dikinase
VTGFGLIGHLGEMLAASLAGAELDPAAVPLYPGALALAQAGISSTLLPENLALASLLRGEFEPALRTLLFDPQTSGGLLAGVPADRAEACVAALRAKGYVHTTIVGRVTGAVRAARDVSIAVGRVSP